MEALLKDINAVVGVTGTFVCAVDGSVLAKSMPETFDAAQLELAARVAGQTFQALETTGQRVNEVDLTYAKGRLVLRNLPDGILAILCTRHINIPLLNMTANATVKKLAAELKLATPDHVVAATAAQPAAQPTPSPLPPLVVELEQEIQRIIEAGKHNRLRLRAMGALAVWLACPTHCTLLTPPENKEIELASFLTEGDSIERLCEQLGYQNNRRFNAFYGNRRLNFNDSKRELNVVVLLDNFEMYHKLDLIPFLTQEQVLLPTTILLLTRLQMVEMTDDALRDICALLLEHDLSVGSEKGKIDASFITRLCGDDWGWFKTVSLNLDRLATFAATQLEPSQRGLVVERAQRLKRSIDTAPKSLRWQARARLGETARWYETPQVFRPNATRPDMAIG